MTDVERTPVPTRMAQRARTLGRRYLPVAVAVMCMLLLILLQPAKPVDDRPGVGGLDPFVETTEHAP